MNCPAGSSRLNWPLSCLEMPSLAAWLCGLHNKKSGVRADLQILRADLQVLQRWLDGFCIFTASRRSRNEKSLQYLQLFDNGRARATIDWPSCSGALRFWKCPGNQGASHADAGTSQVSLLSSPIPVGAQITNETASLGSVNPTRLTSSLPRTVESSLCGRSLQASLSRNRHTKSSVSTGFYKPLETATYPPQRCTACAKTQLLSAHHFTSWNFWMDAYLRTSRCLACQLKTEHWCGTTPYERLPSSTAFLPKAWGSQISERPRASIGDRFRLGQQYASLKLRLLMSKRTRQSGLYLICMTWRLFSEIANSSLGIARALFTGTTKLTIWSFTRLSLVL